MERFEIFWGLVILLGVLGRLFGGAARRGGRGLPMPGPLPRTRLPRARLPRTGRPQSPLPDLGWPFNELFQIDDEEGDAPAESRERAQAPSEGPAGVPAPGPVPAPGAGGPAAAEAVSPGPPPPGEGPAPGQRLVDILASRRPGLSDVSVLSGSGAGAPAQDPRPAPAGPARLSPVARAVAWSVILGPPRAQQPWRPLGWRRGG